MDEDIEAATAVRHESLLDGAFSAIVINGIQSRSQAMAQAHATAEMDLRSRDRELTEIAKSIATLAELFKDLSALVIDQGTLLDSVEYNIEQTAVHMSDAVKELEVATRCVNIAIEPRSALHFRNLLIPSLRCFRRHQKNTGRRACIFLLLLIIFGLIIVLIFKPRRHSSSPSTPDPAPSSSSSIIPSINPDVGSMSTLLLRARSYG